MKPTLSHLGVLLSFLTLASLAHAHPGHEGHELTWDLEHLGAHPFATVLCLAVIGAAGWALTRRALKRRRR